MNQVQTCSNVSGVKLSKRLQMQDDLQWMEHEKWHDWDAVTESAVNENVEMFENDLNAGMVLEMEALSNDELRILRDVTGGEIGRDEFIERRVDVGRKRGRRHGCSGMRMLWGRQ